MNHQVILGDDLETTNIHHEPHNRVDDVEPLRPSALDQVLHEMLILGGFRAAVLTNKDGLPMAAVQTAYDTETTAAMVGFLKRVCEDAQEQLGMDSLDEFTLYDRARNRLVARFFLCGEDELILASMVPSRKPYRLVTNLALKKIMKLLG